MAAPKGNQYYKIRTKDGRETTYSPEQLLEKANEYFQYIIDNPFKRQEVVKMRDHFTKTDVDIMRPFTLSGLCNYLDITEKTFWNYSQREEFLQVTTHIRQVVESQQFEGAAAGLFNANIIARKLGLADKAETKQEGDITISFKD